MKLTLFKNMNLPNKLTMARILSVPVLVLFMLLPGRFCRWMVLALFLLSSLTDLLDGRIARSRNLVTTLGKFLDPLADKALDCTLLICLIPEGLSPAVAVTIIILREFAISGMRLAAAAAGRVVAANMWGKVKTVILTAALGFLLLFRAMDVSWLHTYALIAIWLSAAATAVSGAVYLLQNADVFRETAPKH